MNELKAFAGLDKALARLIVRDGRTRKEIAEAAGINPSVFSGYCSGRLIPSLEHLDRILTTIGVGVEELIYELRALEYRAPGAPLVVWPPFLEKREGQAAPELLTTLLGEVRDLLRVQLKDERMAGGEEAAAADEDEPEPARPGGRRGRRQSAPRQDVRQGG